ncbi:MAG: plasmid partitioning protein RepB [Paracoccaceae bacterium]
MARKNLLKGLMQAAEAEKPQTKSAKTPAPPAKGAIGAVSQSIAELKSRSVMDLDPFLIDPGGVQDRLESDDEEDASLLQSIREYGQQVPVLVRPHPIEKDRYQIVYGRRRVLALRDLGQPVKAMVRDLDDQNLILAQGQENTARRDLSFVEKANFARQLRDEGYKRKIICDALNIDKTEISRMLSVADRIPVEAILAVGSAPGIGRTRWLKLADMLETEAFDGKACAVLAKGETGEDRFEALYHAITLPQRRVREAEKTETRKKVEVSPLTGADGARLGRIRRAAGKTTFVLEAEEEADVAFADWLSEHFEEVHRLWRDRTGNGGA